MRRTIDEGLDLEDNALNLLRLVFASLVIVTHTRRLAGTGAEVAIAHVSFGGLAVGGFFAVSGFLIARSRMHLSGGRFALRRLARIFPGFWLCLVVTAFGLAALVGSQRGGWSVGAAVHYVVVGLPMITMQTSVGQTLQGAPFPDNMNGSLWTLPVELFCYLVLGLALAVPFFWRRLRVVSVVGLIGATLLASVGAAHHSSSGILGLVAAFGAGVVLYAWADRVVLSGWLALAAAVASVASFQTAITTPFAALPYAYLCLWAGAVMWRPLRVIGSRNDISYGVYIYGFPVQQTLVALGAADLGTPIYLVLSLLGAGLLGWFSWIVVERPANEYAKARTARSAARHRRPRLPAVPA